jgi:heterodisulfide reductase subunit C
MAAETSLRPHDVMRLINLDRAERLLEDPSIWLCLTCETCSARCPNQVEPARVIDGVRELAWRRGAQGAPKEVRAFHRAFLKQIRKHGRLFEFGLILGYKFRSGHLFQDVATAPGMMSRGKLGFAPQNIAGAEDVRGIFARCEAAEEEGA